MVLYIFLLLLLAQPYTYSDGFVARYSENGAYNNGNAYLVIQRNKGCIIVENTMFRQFEYPLHSDYYNTYHSFLCEVLNNPSIPLFYNWEEISISPCFKRAPKRIERFMNKYMFRDSNDRIRFKKKLSNRREYGLMKALFDYGYFIGRTDYSAFWFFYESLSPSVKPVPPPPIEHINPDNNPIP